MKRLRRFIVSLVILALPLQGQVAASMACHQSPVQPQAAAIAEQALHMHSDGHAHVHAHVHDQQVSDKAQNLSFDDDANTQQSASADEATVCAVCAACCVHAALNTKPAAANAVKAEQSVLPKPPTLITTTPPEKLLRPPRANSAV